MAIIDDHNFLCQEERGAYHALLKVHGHMPHHFVLEVTEDQSSVDMNDVQYVIMVTAQATHVSSQKSKTYFSRVGSGTWLAEFEDDLKKRYFAEEK